MKRGQGAVEYVLVLAIIAAFVAGVALEGFRQQELNFALAASRHATLEYIATQNTSLTLAGMDYEISAANTTLKPRLYVGTTLVTNATGLTGYPYFVLDRVRKTLRPTSPLNENQTCVQGATALYCCCG